MPTTVSINTIKPITEKSKNKLQYDLSRGPKNWSWNLSNVIIYIKSV